MIPEEFRFLSKEWGALHVEKQWTAIFYSNTEGNSFNSFLKSKGYKQPPLAEPDKLVPYPSYYKVRLGEPKE